MTVSQARERLQREGATFHSRQPIQNGTGAVVDWYWSAQKRTWFAAEYRGHEVTLRAVAAENCQC